MKKNTVITIAVLIGAFFLYKKFIANKAKVNLGLGPGTAARQDLYQPRNIWS